MILTEIFAMKPNSSFEKSHSNEEVTFKTKLSDDSDLTINFYPTGNGKTSEVVFGRKGVNDEHETTEKTGTGLEYEVMSNVVHAIDRYLKDVQPPELVFTASTRIRSGENERKAFNRAKLYSKMIKRMAGNYGYKCYEFQHPVFTEYVFQLVRNGEEPSSRNDLL